MVLHPSRIIILLFFVGFLSVQQEVLGMSSLEIVLRQSQEDHRIMLQNQQTSKATSKEVLNTKKNSANISNGFNPNESSKRRVRRGSDPIHNRN
ncbi:hypothetical protein RIF29_15931 [Crotalaria pallida]|uniref:Uncharacterized protein n=1 Tax=Crotalaria pallida TaxID=3830 RepID=A0AAN9FEH1_CROPI